MKNLLEKLGISITELSYLLLLPNSTISSWFGRSSSVPAKHSVFLSAFYIYDANNTENDLIALAEKWKQDNQSILDEAKQKAFKKLRFELLGTQFQLEKLKLQQSKQLRRWHLAQKFADYLPEGVHTDEDVQAWVSLIGRKSRLKYGDLSIERLRLEQKIAGLEAEISYLEKSSAPKV